MDQLAQYAQQLGDIYNEHAPTLRASLPTAVMTLVFGVTICVLGAKLARWLITVAFAAGGLVAGLLLGGQTDVAPLAVALMGAAALGAVGFVLHRLWVGLATGAFLASVAFGVISAQMILPHVEEFRELQLTAAREEVTHFEPGPVGEAMQVSWDHVRNTTASLIDFAIAKEPNLRKYGFLGVIFAGGLGLLMGIFLCRLTLILFSAAFGTSLIAVGLTMLGGHLQVDILELCQQRPEMSAVALACFFVFSIILQTLLTRRARSSGAAE